jgi:predicted nucleic acid-binding protein
MSELCIDASVVVKLAFRREAHRTTARRLVGDCLAQNIQLIAPPFFFSEVDTAVRRRVYEGTLTAADGRKAFAVLDKVAVHLVTHPLLRQRARTIAEQFNQRTVYDASYVALAELRGCEFWTADRALYSAVQAALPFVKYLPNYP